MKKLSFIFVILSMVINFVNGLTNVFQYDSMVQIFAEAGLEFPISKSFFVSICILSMIVPLLLGTIDLIFLTKKGTSDSALLGLGIASIFFVGLLGGIFMTIYASQRKTAGTIPSGNTGFPSNNSPQANPSASKPSDYNAPRDFFKVGDEVLTPDGRKGKITSIQDSLANVHFEDGGNDLLVGTDALKRP